MAVKRQRLRYWWLTYNVYIHCPFCEICIVPIEEVWCGCTALPRKLKKWCKGRRDVYKIPHEVAHPLEGGGYVGYHTTGGDKR